MADEGVFPCLIVSDFSTCHFSNWDTLVIELSIGAILAGIFFYMQHRNAKKLLSVWQSRHEQTHAVMKSFLETIYSGLSYHVDPNQKIIPSILREHYSKFHPLYWIYSRDRSKPQFMSINQLKKFVKHVDNILGEDYDIIHVGLKEKIKHVLWDLNTELDKFGKIPKEEFKNNCRANIENIRDILDHDLKNYPTIGHLDHKYLKQYWLKKFSEKEET